MVIIKLFITTIVLIIRRREWDLTSEAESAAEIVKDLQHENQELCDKERMRVEDERERELDLEEELILKRTREKSKVTIQQYSRYIKYIYGFR